MKIAAVILTRNEERHIERCIASARQVAGSVLVVDSFSDDRTMEIAQFHGAQVIRSAWINYATQFNWALTQLDPDTDWVMRVDADEYLTRELAEGLNAALPGLESDVDGVCVNRRIRFLGRPIRFGGVFPTQVVRVFRYGKGRCEQRWMDEHIMVSGRTVGVQGELVDDNLNSLTWWIDKHNGYASREAVDLLNLRFGFLPHESVASLGGSQAGTKRWIKEQVYARLPGGIRALAYFVYRYVLRLGFLDGRAGTTFHFLQGLWYRYLVDAKVREVERYMAEHGVDAIVAIKKVLEIDVLAARHNQGT